MRKLLSLTFLALLLAAPFGAEAFSVGPNLPYARQTFKLSQQEVKDLLHMREEEKLARDVYLTLSKKYPLPIFRNIARSESRHMEMVGLLLKKYGLPDPVQETGNRVGVFKDPALQELYRKLVSQGERSLVDALKVGATIEDLDIADLERAVKDTDKPDIKTVYYNLMKGSRNHMRAFVRLLRRYGGSYSPQYISQAQFNRILSTPHEAGFYAPNGKVSTVSSLYHLKGKVVSVKQVPLGRRGVKWWVVEVEAAGKLFSLRVAPVWWYPDFSVSPGDQVEVSAFQPPYWRLKGVNVLVVCTLTDNSNGKVYDFSRWRRFCGN
jgi:hypothetical protein